ncbi:MAG: CoA-acylating methylmalonate-semialdehyde dehydrogenase [Pseudomonadota bacterium]
MGVVDHYIKGEPVNSYTEKEDLVNPSTGDVSASVLYGGASEVDAAVAAAKEAQKSWARSGLVARGEMLLEVRELMRRDRDTLIDFCINEGGKTRNDAIAEVAKGIETLSFNSAVSSWYNTRLTQNVSGGVDTHEARFPIGVVAAVAPFNFPVLVPMLQTGMALACGNAVVVKPSEKVPSSMRHIAEYFAQAGFPDGLVNVVNGGRAVVERMIEHPDVAGLTFVGSTPVAKALRVRGVELDKRVQAFGSGKNHMIVLPDADLGMAADAAVSAAYGAAGQRCMAISVLVAVGDIGDELVAKIKERIPNVRLGSALDDNTELGPVISAQSRERIHEFIEQAAPGGAEVVVDGRLDNPVGNLVGATLVDHVTPGMRLHDEEVFGPVLSVVRAETYEDAMQIVDDHPLGNGAAIFTRDGGAAREYTHDIRAGCVGVNVPIPVPIFSHSFGGWKGSAFTETRLSGPEAMAFHTRIKTITTRWPDPSTSRVDLGFPSSR